MYLLFKSYVIFQLAMSVASGGITEHPNIHPPQPKRPIYKAIWSGYNSN